jgi:hypothetical protein
MTSERAHLKGVGCVDGAHGMYHIVVVARVELLIQDDG